MGQRCMTATMVAVLALVTGCAPSAAPERADSFTAPERAVPAPTTTAALVRSAVESASVTAPPTTEGAPDHLTPPGPETGPPTTVVIRVVEAAPAPTPTTTLAAATPAPTLAAATPAPTPTTTLAAPAPSPTTTTAPPAPTTTAPPPPTTTVAVVAPSGVASAFLSDVNGLRASVGAGSLSRNGTLDAMAQSWSDRMAADDWLRHSTLIHDAIDQGFAAAGENIAYGPDEPSMFAGLRASPGHYANMVNPAYTQMGVGVTVVGNVIWTAHLFAG